MKTSVPRPMYTGTSPSDSRSASLNGALARCARRPPGESPGHTTRGRCTARAQSASSCFVTVTHASRFRQRPRSHTGRLPSGSGPISSSNSTQRTRTRRHYQGRTRRRDPRRGDTSAPSLRSTRLTEATPISAATLAPLRAWRRAGQDLVGKLRVGDELGSPQAEQPRASDGRADDGCCKNPSLRLAQHHSAERQVGDEQ
jgi:hypothetical protein